MTQFADDPAEYFGHKGHVAQHLPRDEQEASQMEALQARFGALRDRLPALKAMADEQDIAGITAFDDVAPLLFPHTVYKSYPLSLLENNRFEKLTRWLSRLTTHDLSAVQDKRFDSIDGWLQALDDSTELWATHSSGTTGTMSFLPRSRAEFEVFFKLQKMNLFECVDPEGAEDHADDHLDVIWPTFARGRSGTHRSAEFFKRDIAGSPDRFHPLHDTAISADVMFLAGRIRRAQSRGELDTLDISPALKARQAEFMELQNNMASSLARLFEKTLTDLKGRRLLLIGQMAAIHDFARDGIERGVTNAFAPGSIVQTGGGQKGQPMPEDWEQIVQRFTGVPRLAHTYGMTELNMTCYRCECGRYHIPPWVIPFVLDPDTGAPYPRTGVHKGRAAFFDLVPQSYWGGFVSGDEVEIDWSVCACGRTTPHLDAHIERYSEKRGGDDKINCAAAEDAHEAALDVLAGSLI